MLYSDFSGVQNCQRNRKCNVLVWVPFVDYNLSSHVADTLCSAPAALIIDRPWLVGV
jgi:hypothetical protein